MKPIHLNSSFIFKKYYIMSVRNILPTVGFYYKLFADFSGAEGLLYYIPLH